MNYKYKSLKFKLGFNVLLFILFFIAVSIFSLYSIQKINDAYHHVKDDALPDIVAILELKASFNKMFMELQNYMNTGNSEELGEFNEEITLFNNTLKRYIIAEDDLLEKEIKRDFRTHRDALIDMSKKSIELKEEINESFEKLETMERALADLYEAALSKSDLLHSGNITVLDALVHQSSFLLHEIFEYATVYTEEEEGEGEELPEISDKERDNHKDTMEWIAEAREEIERLMKQITEPEGLSADFIDNLHKLLSLSADTIVLIDELRELFEGVEDFEDDISFTVTKAVDNQNSEIDTMTKNVKALIEISKTRLIILMIIFIIIISCITYYTIRKMLAGITNLVEAMNKISKGDLDHRTNVTSDDEIGQLSDSFNIMTEELQSITISRDSLEEHVMERTKELEIARNKAQESSKIKGEFLANMSHEIRTPLNAVTSLTDLALKASPPLHIRRYLSRILISSKSLLSIINDILDFSKMDAGKLNLESTSFQLSEIFNHLADIFGRDSAEKDIELILFIPPELPSALMGDPLRLKQVISNLLGNSMKFTEKGEIALKVKLVEQVDDKVVLEFSVKDTGLGIEHDKINTLFNSFTQADGSTSRKYGGTGLGLAISKHIVEMMNGRIWAESTPGKGSTFYFTAKFGCEAEKEKQHLSCDSLSGMKVLIVDDNDSNREALTELVRSLSFDPVSVNSGEEAIKSLHSSATEESPYGVILMDYNMPVKNGFETSGEILSRDEFFGKYNQVDPPTRIPKIVLMITLGNEEIMEKAVNVGIDDFLIKPVTQSVLFDTIMKLFGQSCITGLSHSSTRVDEDEVKSLIGGAKVLVVDDNSINRQVAEEYLERVRVTVSMAVNGLEAVSLTDKNYYDAVLMDIQMPEMDGFQATAKMRGDERFHELPIIAMTAHAMKGDQERCLSSGMDDYVTKPIEPEMLYAKLMKWIKKTEKSLPAEEVLLPALGERDESELPDLLPGIDQETIMKRFRGNTKKIEGLLMDFYKDFNESQSKIRAMLNNDELESAGEAIHTIKGVAGNLAAHDLHSAASELEKSMVNKEKDSLNSIVDRFEKAMSLVLNSCKEIVEANEKRSLTKETPHGEDSEITLDKEKIEPLIKELHTLLEGQNIKAAKRVLDLKEYLKNSKYEKEIEGVDEMLRRFDFKSALELLNTIAVALDIPLK